MFFLVGYLFTPFFEFVSKVMDTTDYIIDDWCTLITLNVILVYINF